MQGKKKNEKPEGSTGQPGRLSMNDAVLLVVITVSMLRVHHFFIVRILVPFIYDKVVQKNARCNGEDDAPLPLSSSG